MKCIKNYISLFSLVASSVLFSQTTPDYYKQMYDNQQRSQNTIVEQPIAKSLTPKEIVDEGISRMMTDPVLRNAQWGFVIYDPKTKKIVNSYNEMMPLIPASTTKLLTTDTALDLLG
ncbi:MAG: D-alanyl-D-alanine carboxypeptidase, partial [Bergeyella zoohelcum]|nr:D-alanyl-D-alanine carboxypeptidase [Bergeyella zoohelcum]